MGAIEYRLTSVPGVGFEPTCPEGRRGLGPPRLPGFATRAEKLYARPGSDVFASVGVSLGVAVWAKNPKIDQPIIVAPSIDVIQFQGDGVPVP